MGNVLQCVFDEIQSVFGTELIEIVTAGTSHGTKKVDGTRRKASGTSRNAGTSHKECRVL